MTDGTPDFSIIIPTRNRPAALQRCLASLEKLENPGLRFEVLVVDNGSRPPVSQVVHRFDRGMKVRCLRQLQKGPAAARNRGCKAAAGRFIACIDDDCTASPDWLQNLYARLSISPDHLVGGHTVNALTSNPFSTASQMLIDYLFTYYNSGMDSAVFVTSNNMAFAADRFHSMGGFDPRFTGAGAEDRDFCRHWRRAGYPISYLPLAVVFHHHALNLRTFLQQHASYGQGAYAFHRKQASTMRRSIRLEPPIFYGSLLISPFKLRSTRRSNLLLAGLLALSQIANAAGFFWNWYINATLPRIPPDHATTLQTR